MKNHILTKFINDNSPWQTTTTNAIKSKHVNHKFLHHWHPWHVEYFQSINLFIIARSATYSLLFPGNIIQWHQTNWRAVRWSLLNRLEGDRVNTHLGQHLVQAVKSSSSDILMLELTSIPSKIGIRVSLLITMNSERLEARPVMHLSFLFHSLPCCFTTVPAY